MKKIHVQNKFSHLQAIIISTVAVLFGVAILFFVFSSDFASAHTRGKSVALISMIFFFIPIWMNNAASKEKYVSEIQLTDSDLILVYKQGKEISPFTIRLEDICSIHAKLMANIVKAGKGNVMTCKTDVCIKTNSGKMIYFSEDPTTSLSFCNYSFMLRLLSIAKYLPNFTYDVEGNAEVAKEDIKFYALHGKRLGLAKKFQIELKNYPLIVKIILSFSFIIFFLCMSMIIYSSIPAFVSDTDKGYRDYIEAGYNYYKSKDYNKSLIEYDKAFNIHNDDPVLYYYKALSFQRSEQPEKAIETAKEGIKYLDNNSAYYKAKNYKYTKKTDGIGLYTVLGENYQIIERFDKAEKAYDYIIENGHYKYTDAYLWRGWCRYKQDKPNAKEDFFKHKEIVDTYIEDQKNSDYPDYYPQFDQEDIERANNWIKHYNN